MKRFTKLMIAVAIVAMAIPAFSAVENIKVGGDMDMYGIMRRNFFPFGSDDTADHYMTSARIYVQAQLTGNVEAMVRLINERMWGTDYYSGGADWMRDICLDLAYIKVSNLGIDGLDLTLGRQEIQLGEGLVVGSAFIPQFNYPGGEMFLMAEDLAFIPQFNYPGGEMFLMAEDLGKQKAFDAIRVDYKAASAPVDVTVFMAKVQEWLSDTDDLNLYGLNVGFGVKDTLRLEGYYVRVQPMDDIDMNVTTLGVRATGEVGGLGLKGEYARQIGEIFPGVDNEGWALLLGGQYNFDAAVSGNIHANLNLYSGDDGSSDNTGWTTMFPANTASRIGAVNYALVTGIMGPMGLMNAQVINLGAGIKPVEKVGLAIDWFNLRYLEDVAWDGGESAIGNEIDASVVYNYTEDLSFGLQYGILMVGDALENVFYDDPWQLIASAKIAF